MEFYLANLLMRMDRKAIRNMASELSMVFSTSLNSRLHRRTGLKLSPGGEPETLADVRTDAAAVVKVTQEKQALLASQKSDSNSRSKPVLPS